MVVKALFKELTTFGVSLLLGSGWALIPAGMVALLFIVRTFLEDRTLQKELPGCFNIDTAV